MMLPHIADEVDALVDCYDLHASLPVDIWQLEPMFPAIHADTDTTTVAGMVILPQSLPVTEQNFARVILSDKLTPYECRLVYAHEVAHGIIGHEGELRMAPMDRWFTDKAEREAWEVASRLLVPIRAVVEYEDVTSIAHACRVPQEMVKLAYR
jgi:Zn-dependent peptidase ImmA (M78 family)